MRGLRILELTSTASPATGAPVRKYRLNEESGLYNEIANNDTIIENSEPKGLYDLLFDRLYKITKVKRTDNTVFSIGSRITSGTLNSTLIIFNFVKNKIRKHTDKILRRSFFMTHQLS